MNASYQRTHAHPQRPQHARNRTHAALFCVYWLMWGYVITRGGGTQLHNINTTKHKSAPQKYVMEGIEVQNKKN